MSFWREVNYKKYDCTYCGYYTCNKTNFTRHLKTAKCFLRRNSWRLPDELKTLIMCYARREFNDEFRARRAVPRFCVCTTLGRRVYNQRRRRPFGS